MAADWLTAVPPSDRWRSECAEAVLSRLGSVIEWAEITRIAELTELDRIGMPVFQAVRPMSRALSVHQGKGANIADARLSAAMEAIESSAAEQVTPGDMIAARVELPCSRRMQTLAEYGRRSAGLQQADDARIRWLLAEDIADGGDMFVPFDLVTLDFSAEPDAFFVRSSLGLAAGASLQDATTAALYELVEREAQAKWLASGMIGQAIDRVDPGTIRIGWFSALADHLARLGLRLSVYAKHGIGGLPVVICRIDEPGFAPSFAGAACRPDADDALLRAFGEAAQSRLTVISGARDDIEVNEPTENGARALGTPPGYPKVDWRRFSDTTPNEGADFVVQALADAGIKRIARVQLHPPVGDVSVVKLVAPGLRSSPEQFA